MSDQENQGFDLNNFSVNLAPKQKLKEGSEFVQYVPQKLVRSPNLETPQEKMKWEYIQKNILTYIEAKIPENCSQIIFPINEGWEFVVSENDETILEASSCQIHFVFFTPTWEQSIGYLLAISDLVQWYSEAAFSVVNPNNLILYHQISHPFFFLNHRYDNPGIWLVIATTSYPTSSGVWEKFLEILDDVAYGYEQQFRKLGGYTMEQWNKVTTYLNNKYPEEKKKGGSDESKK